MAHAAPAIPWQWCRFDATRALAAAVAPSVASLLSSVFSMPSGTACQRRFAEVALALQAFAPNAHARMMGAEADLLGFIWVWLRWSDTDELVLMLAARMAWH